MGNATERIFGDALALPPDAKADLAERLLRSLDDPGQAAVDAAWAEEAHERLTAYDAGLIQSTPVEEVLRNLRERKR